MKRGVYKLRITCANDYPGNMSEAAASIAALRPRGAVCCLRGEGCIAVTAYWKHWPCVFPQHGPGRKLKRLIALEDWQRDIVEEHPGPFLRGLFHSAGCRITNWTVRPVAGAPKRYEYPRYFFSNASTDIIALCGWALDLLHIAWRLPRPDLLSVARRADVAALDAHVGPKY